jgi:hypothetical protein
MSAHDYYSGKGLQLQSKYSSGHGTVVLQYDRDPELDTIWYGRRLETVHITIAEDGSMSETIEEWTGAPSNVNHYLVLAEAPPELPTDAQIDAIRQLNREGHPSGYEVIKWIAGKDAADRAGRMHD